MKGYKGFEKDMTCRGFQYEVGKTYTTDRAELCHSGFHFCEQLVDCFDYYDKDDSVFYEVEADGDIKTDGKKSVCTTITIGKEVSPIELNRTKYGNGYGNGDGYGNGYGYGYGNGYGYGDGDGYGNGDGYGDGRNIQKILIYQEEI